MFARKRNVYNWCFLRSHYVQFGNVGLKYSSAFDGDVLVSVPLMS